MDKVNGKLTVFFEEPFWVGIFAFIIKPYGTINLILKLLSYFLC